MADNETFADASQQAASTKAMELKANASVPHHPSADRGSSDGMNNLPNAKIAPSGAFGAEGQRPVLERSRKAR